MELYGNLNNLSKSIFEFDKIYENYTEAQNNAEVDGVLINRYVLINYVSIDEKRRFINLAIDNGWIAPPEKVTYQQILNYCNNRLQELKDYDNSILVKTSDNTYQIVMNFKLTSIENERAANAEFRDASIKTYSDYIKTLSQFFGYNGISTNEIDNIWNNNFNWKDGIVSAQKDDLICHEYEKDGWEFGSTTLSDEEFPIYTNNIKNLTLTTEEIDVGNISDYYVYLYYPINNSSNYKIYRGDSLRYNDSTLSFNSNIVNFGEEGDVSSWKENLTKVSFVKRPEHETNLVPIDAETIKNLWYTGKV